MKLNTVPLQRIAEANVVSGIVSGREALSGDYIVAFETAQDRMISVRLSVDQAAELSRALAGALQ
jgi:hypothetical protein